MVGLEVFEEFEGDAHSLWEGRKHGGTAFCPQRGSDAAGVPREALRGRRFVRWEGKEYGAGFEALHGQQVADPFH